MRIASRTFFIAVLLALAVPAGSCAVVAGARSNDGHIDDPRWKTSKSDEGIWKAVTPPGTTVGEFDSHDPIGLAAGTLIKADCSINWVNPDNGKRFCFSSGTSLVYFLRWPGKNTTRAIKGWQTLTAPSN